MEIFWRDKSRRGPAEIVLAEREDNAHKWAESYPGSQILIGKGRIFIDPTDYSIDGFTLTEQDLEELLQELRKRTG